MLKNEIIQKHREELLSPAESKSVYNHALIQLGFYVSLLTVNLPITVALFGRFMRNKAAGRHYLLAIGAMDIIYFPAMYQSY